MWDEWPTREVSAHPAYVQLFARPGEQAVCVSWRSEKFAVLFPLIVRRIADQPWSQGVDGWDLEGPYGYGGPFWWGASNSDFEPFWEAFDDWTESSQVVAAFARLSLFPDEVAPMLRGDTVTTQMNIIRNLDLNDEALLRDYAQKVRKNVKRALSQGLTVQFDADGSRIDEFISVYTSTMHRRSAADTYYFDEDFFRRICWDLQGQYVFAHASVDGRIVSTELVLLSETHAYSFLGGTLSDSFHLRPNDLLKHEIARWARDNGKTDYVLGGGYGGQDGIYRYKKSFAPKGESEFKVWRHVVDADTYRRAVQARRSYARAIDSPWEPRAGFFPAYRG